jgi:phage terminase large subunit
LSSQIIRIKAQFPPKIEPLFKTKKRFIPIHGGRNSTKSWGAAAKVVISGAAGKKCGCFREVASSVDKTIYELIGNTIERLKIPGYKDTQKEFKHLPSGGNVFTMGLKGGSKLETRTRIKGLEDVDIGWLEEAESATYEILNIYSKTIRKPGSQQIYTFNRFLDLDPVYDKFCKNPDEKTTEVININYYDALEYVPQEEIYEAERLKKLDYDSWLHIYGGEPMSQSDKAILSRTKVSEAMRRSPDTTGLIEVGADIARYGDDSTVFFKRKGLTVIDTKEYKKQSIPETARQLMDFVDRDKDVLIKIDDSGLGGGVTDILTEDGFNVCPVNNGEQAKEKDKYNNSISEQWFDFANMIDDVVIPDNSRLKMELTSRFYKLDSKARRQVESKEDYKKRGFKSPDYADACLLCFYNPISFYGGDDGELTMGRR